MKSILFYLTVLISGSSLAQSPDKYNGKPFFKLTPAVLLVEDAGATPAFFGSIGGIVGRYTAIGVGTGYYKPEESKNGNIPLGIDVTVCDFKAKKTSPVFITQLYYPIYNDQTSTYVNGGEDMYSTVTNIKGKFMYNVGGGVALPIFHDKKLLVTGGFGQVFTRRSETDTHDRLVSLPGGGYTSETTINTSSANKNTILVTIAVSFML